MLAFRYKIKRKSKDKGDYRITKHGQVAEFSLRELDRQIEQAKKQLKEMEINARLQEAFAQNIRRENPDLAKYIQALTPRKKHALTMLAIQQNKAKQFKDQEKISRSILRNLLRENKVVRKQLKL